MIQHTTLFRRFATTPSRKEGQSLPPTRLRRRRTTTYYRLIIITFIILASYAFHLSRRESQDVQNVGGTSIKRRQDMAPTHSKSMADVFSTSISAESTPYQTPTHAKRVEHQLPLELDPDTPRHSVHVHSLAHQILDFDKWPQFDVAFKRVLSSLPDELHTRELLRPFEGTGVEKLRDIGLRARAFKTLFEAWEALHLVWNGDIPYIRQDVVQYLRNRHGMEKLPSRRLAQASTNYESYRHVFQQLSQLLFPWTAPYFPDHMSLHVHFHGGGRGIVFTAGNGQAPYLLASIASFRRLGCTLPIEIMYLGDADLSEDYRAELEALEGVITRDLSRMINDEGWKLAGWAAKPFAILHSSFREVLFIDADALFFTNPELLFDDPLYVETGALFFKDRLLMPESKKLWLQQILARPVSKQVMQSRLWRGESSHMQESGAMVVDKWTHFVALLMVTRMNGPDRDGNEGEGRIGVYDMVYGDKETFWIGWELVGDRDYAFHPGDAAVMGVIQQKSSEESSQTTNDNAEKSSEKTEDNAEESSEKIGDDAEEDSKKTEDDAEEGSKKIEDDAEEGSKKTEDDAEENSEKKGENDEEGATGKDDISEQDAEKTAFQRSEKAHEQEDEVSESDHEVPDGNFTICAPQLLHLDRDGRPLWFNGWVLKIKSATSEYSRFEAYLKEPREVTEPGAWQLKEDNVCCLTANQTFTFSEDEEDVLEMIIGLAKAVAVRDRN